LRIDESLWISCVSLSDSIRDRHELENAVATPEGEPIEHSTGCSAVSVRERMFVSDEKMKNRSLHDRMKEILLCVFLVRECAELSDPLGDCFGRRGLVDDFIGSFVDHADRFAWPSKASRFVRVVQRVACEGPLELDEHLGGERFMEKAFDVLHRDV